MADSKEMRGIAGAFRDPKTLKKKLVLAIALAPPKSRSSKSRGSRQRPRRR